MAIDYAGFDIALDTKGVYWLIEINSSPNYDIFVRDNDRQIVVTMFKGILESLIINKKPWMFDFKEEIDYGQSAA